MKLLITGAKGVLGSALAKAGVDRGLEVIPLDRAALDINDADAVRASMAHAGPDASTGSSGAGPAAREIPAPPGSSSPWKTTSCASS